MKQIRKVLLYIDVLLCFLLGAFFLWGYTAMRFSGFLLLCAGAVQILWAILCRLSNNGKLWAGWSRRVLAVLLAMGFTLFCAMEIWVLSYAHTDDTTEVSAMIVFGAGVNGTVPSLSLRVRLEAALEYARARPGIPIVVSGSQGPGEDITEARCMADWLIARGVEPERIWLEERANNTEENVRFSRQLLQQNGVDPTDNIAYVTADYHLCRAIYLTGYPYCVPVAAHMPEQFWLLTVNYYIREAFAMAKLLLLP